MLGLKLNHVSKRGHWHKRENTVLHFYVRPWKFTQSPLQINMKIDVFFLLPRTPVRLNHCMHSFACSCWPGNIYRYVISTKILARSTNYIEVVLMFKKNKSKIVYGRDGGAGVNLCLHHARNRIAVQNNALISIISFTLKQVNWFCQLSPT